MYKIIKKNSLLLAHLPFIVYVIILTWFLALPSVKFVEVFAISDKIEHFFAFFVLTFLFAFSVHFQTRFKNYSKAVFVIVLLIVAVYGAATEIMQSFIPGRSCDFIDWLLDFSGAIIGIVVFIPFIKFISEEKESK
ncbi:MAG: VanZ family protein [bacterium]